MTYSLSCNIFFMFSGRNLGENVFQKISKHANQTTEASLGYNL